MSRRRMEPQEEEEEEEEEEFPLIYSHDVGWHHIPIDNK